MKASKLHTLEDLLTEGIKIEGQEESIKISSIFIPKIQRSYAQGRKTEKDVRKDFLDDIFKILLSDKEENLELSFLFGSKQCLTNGEEGFELLDGQQRATTLFLIYWYINEKEKQSLPCYLSKFTYETRDSSIDFLKNITAENNGITLEDRTPSEAIKSKKWFTDEFLCDPTICSMLTMLDAIDTKYRENNCQNLEGNLGRLCFYVLLLENFDMNDELYIKMNSRGLSLVPFENFKASIVRYMKARERNEKYGTLQPENGKTPFWLRFISKIDAIWIDLFWTYEKNDSAPVDSIIETDDKEIGKRFFRFFNRFFFVKSALKKGIEKEKLNSLSAFFYDKDPKKNEEEIDRLTGWDKYEEMFDLDETCLESAEIVLDRLRDDYEEIKEMVQDDPFGNTKNFDLSMKGITLANRVAFAVVILFLEKIPINKTFQDTKENFRQILRVLHNIIENTPIETAVPAYSVISAMNDLINLPGAVDDNFYRSIAKYHVKSRNKQLEEEVVKARQMFNSKDEFDQNWETAFIKAENHPYFKGSVLFFFTEDAGSSEDFLARYEVVKDLFDENGIAPNFRKDHLLIRALISQINYWEKSGRGLKNRYITENVTQDKHLKQILINFEEVRNFFCSYFGSNKSLNDYFEECIQNSKTENEGDYFDLMFKRLTKDPKSVQLFNWISNVESKKKPLCIQNNRGAYLLNIPGSWYDRILLDTDRHIMVERLNHMGFEYKDSSQKDMIKSPLGDTWGWDIALTKDVDGKTEKFIMEVKFQPWKLVEFIVSGIDNTIIISKFNRSESDIRETGIKVSEMAYCYDKDFNQIEKELNEIEKKIKTI